MSQNSAILPPEQEVACSCNVRLHRPVYRDHTGVNERVSACMRCGTVTFTESLVEEPHPNDVRCVGNRVQEIDVTVLEWLSAWPRLAWGVWSQDRAIYLPAALRCETVEELKAFEEAALEAQRGLELRERLQRAGVPATPAPARLPGVLRSFAETWEGLQLNEQTELDTLLELVGSYHWGAMFARPLLERRANIVEEIVALLQSNNPVKYRAGLALASRRKPAEPAVIAALVARLRSSPRQETVLEPLLDTLVSLGTQAAEASPILKEIAERIGDHDYYLRKRVEQVRDLISPSPAR